MPDARSSPAAPAAIADRLRAAVAGAPDRRVPTLRKLRASATRELRDRDGVAAIGVARALLADPDVPRWLAYEIVHHQPATLAALTPETVEELGRGMSDWGEVDPFGVYVVGPAWREGRLADDDVHRWARSPDRWWRRAALVATVALNTAARGGRGDAPRTLAVCEMLLDDRDDMVVKALSWALRALAVREPDAVGDFLDRKEPVLARRVVREVRSKLATGLKNPGRRTGESGS